MGIINFFLVAILALGVHGEDGDDREKLVGATVANVGEFPYQVSLRVGNDHICGGALITRRHVLTAAHCVYAIYRYGYANSYAVVGTNSLAYGGQSYRIAGLDCHPSYVDRENTDWMYDIGVVTLASDVTLSNLVTLISLPVRNIVPGTRAVISGWGSMLNPRSGSSVNLLKLMLTIIDHQSCQARMPNFARIHETFICTFLQQGKGTCSGDSGGPLVQNGYIVGVVSGGIPCALGYPDVFTNVFMFMDYVKKAIGQYN